jgi:hypothetical protein
LFFLEVEDFFEDLEAVDEVIDFVEVTTEELSSGQPSI